MEKCKKELGEKIGESYKQKELKTLCEYPI